jgi:large subunit ribosomal protein L15
MELNNLPSIVSRGKKRIGHGIGSGKGGHTSTRGMKGQGARRSIHPLFEGTKNKKSLLQRLPLIRGKGKLKSLQEKSIIVNLSDLNSLPEKTVVDVQTLVKNGIVSGKALKVGVKILSKGEIQKALIIEVPVSKKALEKVQKAGGSSTPKEA